MSEHIKREEALSQVFLLSERRRIKQIPAADVAPVVHGEWIKVYGDFSTAECVVCKSQFEVTFGEESNGALWDGFCQFYRYCPYCGARMDGEQK